MDNEFLVYVASRGGYELETRTGVIPEPGDLLDDAGEVIVLTIGRSPFAEDALPCVFAIT